MISIFCIIKLSDIVHEMLIVPQGRTSMGEILEVQTVHCSFLVAVGTHTPM